VVGEVKAGIGEVGEDASPQGCRFVFFSFRAFSMELGGVPVWEHRKIPPALCPGDLNRQLPADLPTLI
jgi:hypothetical protein